MPSLVTMFAPLALFVTDPAAQQKAEPRLTPQTEAEAESPARKGAGWLSLEAMEHFEQNQVQEQVRIEQRVIIRIAPRRPSRQNLTSSLPQRGMPRQMAEKKIGRCVPMKSIGAVQADRANRLLLFMRDKRIIAANLERACSARDFYSGFYVEPSKDGKLCVERDRLQSRTGTKCQLSAIRELVPFDT